MRIGVPTEVKPDEYRVAITPDGVRELVGRGHHVRVQSGAGLGSALPDTAFAQQGAEIVPDAEAVFADAELVLKVKEPQPQEVERLRRGQTLFTYLHLAAVPQLARALCETGATCIAYETVEVDGRLPLLAPMSEVAGKIATQAGAFVLGRPIGGRGILLGGVPGVSPATVLVIGGGIVGLNAAMIAIGMQANVYVLERSIERMRDLVIGAVLVRGARAPFVVRREQLALMRERAVLVDVAIDQGGCFETSRPTTHSKPTYELDGVIHYCVANMPGAVPITSTYALTNATLPFCLELADRGVQAALAASAPLRSGVNVRDGEIVHPAVAEALASDASHHDGQLAGAVGSA
jgi:alanine dehydrogenase